jgi:hypothetical protein
MSRRLQQLAQRKLPEIHALIDRAQRVQSWLESATGCNCQSVDECGLSDGTAASPAGHRRGALDVLHVDAAA